MALMSAHKFFDSKKSLFFAAVALLLWIMRIPQTIPTLGLDRGVYVSSAERLLAGDKLYAEIFEAKDPIFIWQIAFSRALSPLMDIVLENLWVLLASYAIFWLSRLNDFPVYVAIFIGFIISPVILTGVNYRPGYSHLPGVAVVFLIVALLTIFVDHICTNLARKKTYFVSDRYRHDCWANVSCIDTVNSRGIHSIFRNTRV
jgi:hypothetical protein